MANLLRPLVFVTLAFCVIFNDVDINDPVVLPILIQLIGQMENDRKDKGNDKGD
jgi:hypothetical protein